jgi:hypothetical protein
MSVGHDSPEDMHICAVIEITWTRDEASHSLLEMWEWECHEPVFCEPTVCAIDSALLSIRASIFQSGSLFFAPGILAHESRQPSNFSGYS